MEFTKNLPAQIMNPEILMNGVAVDLSPLDIIVSTILSVVLFIKRGG